MKRICDLIFCLFVMLLSGCVPGSNGNLHYGNSLLGLSPEAKNIRMEDNKELVMEVQVALRELGYREVGRADGIYGKKTRKAILAFETDTGAQRDGHVTYGLLRKLRKECRLAGVSLPQAYKKSKKRRKSRVTREGKELTTTMGVLGGVAGAVIGGVSAGDPTIGAAVGTVVGVGVGTAVAGVINSETMKKFDNYIQRYNRIEDGIKTADNRLALLKKEIADVEARISVREKKIAELEKRSEKGADFKNEAKAILAELEQELRKNRRLSDKVRKDILILKKNIKDISKDIRRSPKNQILKRKKERLVDRKAGMQASLEKINAMAPKLESQKENIASLIT